jgi:hypothetical protein
VALVFPFLLGLAVSVVLGGDLRRLADLRLRGIRLFYGAVALQLAAFPFGPLPWHVPDRAGSALWLASYALLLAAAAANVRVPGVGLVAAGMLANVVAVVANGGHMPVRRAAMRAAGLDYTVHNNSAALAHPRLEWLVDRWAAPHWVPLANVYSVGDALIALGGFVFALAVTRAVTRRRGASPGPAVGDRRPAVAAERLRA